MTEENENRIKCPHCGSEHYIPVQRGARLGIEGLKNDIKT